MFESHILVPPIIHPLSYKLLVLDADGTLRRCTVPGQPCPHAEDEWELMPQVAAVLSRYDWVHTGIGIVSNQGGVALGVLSHGMAQHLLEHLLDRLAAAVYARTPWTRLPRYLTVYGSEACLRFCPHAPHDDCPCRKPSPLMLLDIVRAYHMALKDVLYVGDLDTDRQAAERAGIAYCHAADFFGWEHDV